MDEKGLKFRWAPKEGEAEADYTVTLKGFERPVGELVFVLEVDDGRGKRFTVRKTPTNFGKLQSEVVKNCPRWPSAKMPLPGQKRSGLGALFSFGSNGCIADSDEQAWDQCKSFVLQFVEDYTANESSPELKAIGTGPDCHNGQTVAEHLRVSLRCLFFLQRDASIDTLDSTAKWRREQVLQLKNSKGQSLFMRQFTPYEPATLTPIEPKDPRAVCIMIHGYADQGDSDYFLQTAKHVTSVGLVAYSVDVRGCGQSEGPRMTTRDYMDYVEDHSLLIDEVKKLHPSKKIFLLGQSMGGGMAAKLTLERKDIDGVVLCAPMLKVDETQSPILQKMAPVLASIVPDAKIATLDVATLCHDPYHQRRMRYQAFGYHDKVVTSTGWQMLKFCQDIQDRLHEIDVPYMLLHGTSDEVTAMDASERLHENSLSKDKTFEKIEDSYHDVFLEPTIGEKAFAAVNAWLLERSNP